MCCLFQAKAQSPHDPTQHHPNDVSLVIKQEESSLDSLRQQIEATARMLEQPSFRAQLDARLTSLLQRVQISQEARTLKRLETEVPQYQAALANVEQLKTYPLAAQAITDALDSNVRAQERLRQEIASRALVDQAAKVARDQLRTLVNTEEARQEFARGLIESRILEIAASTNPNDYYIRLDGLYNRSDGPRDLSDVSAAERDRLGYWLPRLLPWAPPRPSALQVLPDSFFRPGGGSTTLGAALDRLTGALREGGHSEYTLYGVPKGFALVTRIEATNAQGIPLNGNARWSARVPALQGFSLTRYIDALLRPESGHYRVMVFIFTPEEFSTRDVTARFDTVRDWGAGGVNKLPTRVRQMPFSKDYAVTALIYEFKKAPGARNASVRYPGNLTVIQHLRRSKLGALAGR